MKINYVPGLALRFFPGLSRELYDGVDNYTATNCKIAIFTGTAPTEQQVWDLGNFTEYVTNNTSALVYQETTSLLFTYDGFKHKRTIQRYPVDSTNIVPLIDPITQDAGAVAAGAIETPNSLYALVYCPDKDTTLNTTGNDLILLIPNVGSGSTDFCSLSKTNFTAGESIYFRNMTVALFQGYQVTDTLINGEYEDPLNPGSMITGPVDSKKSVYINKVWGNRISEAYRDCFISRNTFNWKKADKTSGTFTPDYVKDVPNLFQDINPYLAYRDTFQAKPRKYDKTTSTWTNNIVTDSDKYMYYGFIVNQSLINLIDEINSKGLLGQLSIFTNLVYSTANTTWRFAHTDPYYTGGKDPGTIQTDSNILKRDIVPGLLAKAALTVHQGIDTLNSVTQTLIEQGFDSGLVTSALRSVIPIGFDNTKYNSSFDTSSGVLTIQNQQPAKLKTRYKKSIHNPSNEQLYILIPRYLNRLAIENPFNNESAYTSLTSVSYPATSQVLDGEVVDNTTQRIRQQDYTAVSIGTTGNGKTDLEYDLLDVIDYIDSFTAMLKIPNKF